MAISRPETTATTTSSAAAQPVVTAYPCTRASELVAPACCDTYAVVAVTATVLSTAVPIELPTCIAVLATAAATPARRGSMLLVARLIDGVKTQPMPSPSSSWAGMISVT